jgi:hypothetical protein
MLSANLPFVKRCLKFVLGKERAKIIKLKNETIKKELKWQR